ncbi:Hepatitis A virus cellular receptor 2, partial [Galemys pyrenaicus]
ALEGIQITVEEGKDAILPCIYPRRENPVPVCWGKGACPMSQCHNLVLNTDGTKVKYQISSRYQLKGDIHLGNVSLTITHVTWNDSGSYCCRIEFPGPMNDGKVNLKLVVQPAKVAPVPTQTLLGTPTTQGYYSEAETQTQEPLHDGNQTQSYSLMTEVSPAGSRMGIIYMGAGISAGLLLVLIFGVLIFKCYSHKKEKSQDSSLQQSLFPEPSLALEMLNSRAIFCSHSLVTSASITPSGLVNMATQGSRSEENIYIIEENAYEMEDPYAYYCSVIPDSCLDLSSPSTPGTSC